MILTREDYEVMKAKGMTDEEILAALAEDNKPDSEPESE